MNRRSFLQNTALAGAALSLSPLASCENPSTAATQSTAEANQPFALQGASIADLQKQMASGERTARQIAQLYLDHIQAIDKNGPAINAVIELNPDALAQADALDRERKAGQLRGPLHGIP
ncbi:MAG: twin-arginine translocation signal domain-containing protein, partial [Saprospiraceae bacterium]|nr:twin-arginine translocation signal domain-containing protein [Saprospiraceae bacterium]